MGGWGGGWGEAEGPGGTAHTICLFTLYPVGLGQGMRGLLKDEGDEAVTSGATEMLFYGAPEDQTRGGPELKPLPCPELA